MTEFEVMKRTATLLQRILFKYAIRGKNDYINYINRTWELSRGSEFKALSKDIMRFRNKIPYAGRQEKLGNINIDAFMKSFFKITYLKVFNSSKK